MADPVTPQDGRPSFLYARLIVFARLVVVAGWAGAAYVAVSFIGPLQTGSSLAGLVNSISPAIRTEIASLANFRLPLVAETVVVQHSESGLSVAAQGDTVRAALRFDAAAPKNLRQIAGAIPITNALGAFPSSSEQGTTALTYLLFRPSVSIWHQHILANRYAATFLNRPRDGLVGVTGSLIDENAQAGIIGHALNRIELAGVLLIVAIVGLAFRSVVAPVMTLATALVSYLVSQGLLELATEHLGVTVPSEIGPIIDVLLLGLATDYTVFFLAGFRSHLMAGRPRAAVAATAEVAPLVFVAGFTVAAGVASIATAHLALFSDLAPGLVITVAVTALVAMTLVPAVLALLGRWAFWPGAAGRAGHPADAAIAGARTRARITRLVVRAPVAVVVLVVGTGVLAVAALQVRHSTLALNWVGDLPARSVPARAARAAAAGFVPGIVAPTLMVVHRPGLDRRHQELKRLQTALDEEPGVAGVVGPGLNPSPVTAGIFVSTDGDYARYLIIFRPSPYSAAAIREFRRLRADMPATLETVGLPRAQVSFGGDTTISSELVRVSLSDLIRVGAVAFAVNLVILIVFLRSIVVPFLLVTASALVVVASFGITTWAFAGRMGTPGFTFFVPVAVEVLLISFGSDYNLFLVGRIWSRVARDEGTDIRSVVAEAAAEASAPINVAGITLAGCFGLLAVIPLNSFHEFTFAMGVGLVLDTFLVRLFLVPALLSVLGPRLSRRRPVGSAAGSRSVR